MVNYKTKYFWGVKKFLWGVSEGDFIENNGICPNELNLLVKYLFISSSFINNLILDLINLLLIILSFTIFISSIYFSKLIQLKMNSSK